MAFSYVIKFFRKSIFLAKSLQHLRKICTFAHDKMECFEWLFSQDDLNDKIRESFAMFTSILISLNIKQLNTKKGIRDEHLACNYKGIFENSFNAE